MSPYADREGYVPFGKLVDYAGGRSDGCTSWSRSDAKQVITMMKDDPTTLYIYPEAADINAVTHAATEGRSLSRTGSYWNASCLKEIGTAYVAFWHDSDVPRCQRNVRYRGHVGREILTPSSSPFDPGCVKTLRVEVIRIV